MQKKNLLKAICVALIAISFSCGESASEKTETTITVPATNDSLSSRSAAPKIEDSTKKDAGDPRTTPRIPPAPDTQTPTTSNQ